jgi:hypothetical protein
VSPELQIAVKVFSTVMEAKTPVPVNLDKSTNEPVQVGLVDAFIP